MSLVSVITHNQDGIIRTTRDEKLVIDSVKKHILVICVDQTVTPIDTYEKPFVMEITNSFRVPIVDAQLQPVYENPEEENEQLRIQKSIGEYDMMQFYNDNKLASIKELLTAAILRKKNLNPDTYVFIQA